MELGNINQGYIGDESSITSSRYTAGEKDYNGVDNHIKVNNKDDIEDPQIGSSSRKFKQVVIVAISSLWLTGMAISQAFSNAAESDIRRHGKTFFGGPITLSDTELDMLSSLIYVGSIPGSLIWGWLPGKLGRKRAMMLLVLPHSLGWIVTGLAVNPAMLLIGRFIHGIANGATSVVCNTYTVEIGENSIRGMLVIVTQIAIALGFFISVTLAIGLHYYQYAYLGVALNILAFLLDILLPESPLYLVINDKLDEAKKIMHDLRGNKFNVEKEIQNLKDENNSLMKQSFFQIMKQSKVLKSLVVVTTVFLIQNMCGLYIFYLNATRIIVDSTRSTSGAIDERYAVVYSFIFQLTGTVLAITYIDRIGRKKSIIMSLLLVAMFNFILGTNDMLRNNNDVGVEYMSVNSTKIETRSNIENLEDERSRITANYSKDSSPLLWVPVGCVMGIMFTASLGIEPVPWIISSEYFPTCIRSQASSICTVWANIFAITILQVYSPMQGALGSAGLYFFYGTCSVFGAVFCVIFVKETMGISVG